MSRNNLPGLLGLLAAGMMAVNANAAEKRPAGHARMFMECARACDDCARICAHCTTHCAKLVAEGKKHHLKTLATCADCATICHAAACITARMGPYSDTTCKACADICKRCAEACEEHRDDEMMRRCAEECRRCEKACREMLTHLGGARGSGGGAKTGR